MGRSISVSEGYTSLTSQALSCSLFVAWFAATFAIIIAMCGVGFLRRKPNPSQNKSKYKETAEETAAAPTSTKDPFLEDGAALQLEDAITNPKPETMSELPLPPGRMFKDCQSFNLPKSTSTGGKIKASMSVKMPSMKVLSMSLSRKEDRSRLEKIGKFKRDDSVWTKAIILGEKCQVPAEDEDDPVIYDHKGNRVSAYHPKIQNSLPALTRSTSLS